jgi:hypothetical protein
MRSLKDHGTSMFDKACFQTERADAAEARVETLEKAVEIMRSSAYCEHLHHEKRDRHTFGDTCPVEARLAAALKATP